MFLQLILLFIFAQLGLAAAPACYFTPGYRLTNITKTHVRSGVMLSNNASGYYFATEVFLEDGRVAYFGLQPRSGTEQHLVYSVFGDNTSAIDLEHCHGGADGGGGTSCSADYPWNVGTNYTFEIELIDLNTTDNTWRGRFYNDDATELLSELGTFSTPVSSGLITDGDDNFDEYYPYNGDGLTPAERPCLPRSTGVFFPPQQWDAAGNLYVSKNPTIVNDKQLQDKCANEANAPNQKVYIYDGYLVFENGILTAEYS